MNGEPGAHPTPNRGRGRHPGLCQRLRPSSAPSAAGLVDARRGRPSASCCSLGQRRAEPANVQCVVVGGEIFSGGALAESLTARGGARRFLT